MADVIGAAEFELRASRDKLAKDVRDAERDLKASIGRTEQDYARGGQKAADAFGRSQKQMVRDAKQAETEIRGSAGRISAALIAAAGAFAVGAGATATVQLSDAYTRLSNSLRLAGLEGRNLTDVQEALFATAMQNGVQVETLAQLYGRAAQAAGELGASQADLLQFTSGVSAAIRIQGGDAQSASGAILQLSQALQSGTVRAEEFNSINEGALPILQAVAAGSDRFGGSVAALRAAVMEGTVSSQEFFAAFLAGSKDLETRAAKSVLTVEQGMTNLQTALIKYVGESAAVQGATDALATGLKGLAENLDIIIPSLAAITVGLGVAYVGGVVAATGATAIFTTTVKGLNVALTTLARHPVLIALTAVAAGLTFLALQAQGASRSVEELTEEQDRFNEVLAEGKDLIATAAGNTKDLGDEAASAVPKVNGLCAAVDDLADANYRLADAQAQAWRTRAQTIIAENRDEIERLSNPNLGERLLETDVQKSERASRIENLTNRNALLTSQLIDRSLFSVDPLRFDPQSRTRTGNGNGNGSASRTSRAAADTTQAREMLALENEILAARAAGDEAAAKAAEERLLLAQTIQKYTRAGYEDAQAAALQEVAWLNEIEQLEARRLAMANLMGDYREADLRRAKEAADAAKAAEEARQALEREAAEVEARMRQSFRNAFRDGVKAAMDGDLGGFFESLADRFTDRLLDNLADDLFDILQGALKGQSGGIGSFFSSVFGSIFGGGRAGGGPVKGGMAYRVGEAGPETVLMPSNGFVIPNGGMKAGQASGRQPLTIRMEIDEGGLFEPRVKSISGPIAVQTAEVSFTGARKAVPADMGRRQRFSYGGAR